MSHSITTPRSAQDPATSSGDLRPEPEFVEAIALRVVELLQAERPRDRDPDLIDAAELARRFGMDRAWVYSHASELGAVRLGSGPNARIRFDPKRAERALRPVGDPPSAAPPRRQPARRRSRRSRVELLPVRGAGAADETRG